MATLSTVYEVRFDGKGVAEIEIDLNCRWFGGRALYDADAYAFDGTLVSVPHSTVMRIVEQFEAEKPGALRELESEAVAEAYAYDKAVNLGFRSEEYA